jgi:alcohol dehydrogenase (cytochrome c)
VKKPGKEFSVAVWAAIALGAVGIGVIVAFVAGFFLGHFTGHEKTTTVSAMSAPAEPGGEEAMAPEESDEGESEGASSGEIVEAPVFTADEIAEEAGDNWITNGGGGTNHRFSTLDEINTDNVSELKGDWMTKIGQEATAAKFSAEGQALEYEGTLYISDGADDVFAMDASTGEILWEYKPKLPAEPLGSVICCGWDNRGVALGEGMVFISQLNGQQVALDQQTGKVKWSTEIVKPGGGYSITSAPLYYNGKVYVGGSGGEYGIRGRLTALDSKTGKIEWRFYTIPGPGETGHNTWPKNNDSWKRGGAGIWNTPTVDPKLNMVYFSTSNASPDYYGAERAGDNLFAASIVALDAETGKYEWHYQQVHHDVWDLDSPSPTVFVEGEMEGEDREGIAQPSKTGMLYVLDRKTGKPIFPIEEKPVPQDPKEKTAKTQPYSSLPPFSPLTPTAAAMKATEAGVEDPGTKLEAVPLFTPWNHNPKEVYVSAPDAVGGDNWPPSSFDPERDMYFVCSQSGTLGITPEAADYKAGEQFTGTAGFITNGFNSEGLLTAYDFKTGDIAWQKKFPDSCYSGAVSTAGGLVFVGRNTGELQAYDSETGELLWSFQTGAGANTTVTPFEDEGEEKIAIYAGGNSLAASPHGENFWVFSLKGTMEEIQGTEKEGEGTEHKEAEGGEEEATPEEGSKEGEEGGEEAGAEGGEEEAKEAAAGAGDAAAGMEVFANNCSICHGSTGHGGNGGPDLRSMPKAKTEAGAIEQVTNGGGGMPAFNGQLSEEEISDVAAYVVQKIVGG